MTTCLTMIIGIAIVLAGAYVFDRIFLQYARRQQLVRSYITHLRPHRPSDNPGIGCFLPLLMIVLLVLGMILFFLLPA